MNPKPGALILGGTGRLGAPIAARLDAAGYAVTVFARATSDRKRLEGLPVDYVIGDLLDAESTRAALAGRVFAVVVDASARGPNPDPFYVGLMENTLAALNTGAVKQFILHGSIGAGNSKQVFDSAMYQRVRSVMEEKTRAEELLKASGIPYTIIRNGVIKLDGTAGTGTAQLTEDASAMGTVTRPDLAQLTVQCLQNPECLNKTFHAVDPSWKDDPGY